MTRPTARVLALLEILQNGGLRTVGDLSARLGVDERTVRRYVTHLLDLDVPVESVRGRYGGYRLAPGYRLPPLMLTDDEAVAVLVGLATAPQVADGPTRIAAESASAKVRRVLPRPLAARLGALLDIADFPGRSPVSPQPEVDVLLLVAEAARARRTVEIVHSGRGGVSERTVEPYGVVAHAGRWYLTGRDSASQELRTFRLDRVSTARMGSGTFTTPTGFHPRDEVLAAIARTPWRHAVSVRVHAEADAIRARLPPGIATLTPLSDQEGWRRVEIRAERLDWIPGVLVALDADLVVEGPDELRDRVLALAQRLLASAGG
jgi:predicted DNA-binding transcriptional regulator YafY